MSSLNNILQNHSGCAFESKIKQRYILSLFGEWVSSSSFIDWHFSLLKFSLNKPFVFFDRDVINVCLQLFSANPILILESLEKFDQEITHAVLSMIRPGSSWNKEEQLSTDKPEDLFEFDQIWHPEYQRYCEHIFNHLINIPLYILGKIKGKDYNSPALANRVDILNSNNLNALSEGYNSVVRNAISHGSSRFEHGIINYIDHRREEALTGNNFANLFDKLVDTCHSIVIALLIFLCNKRTDLTKRNIDLLPLGIKYLFVDGIASHSGFVMHSVVESKTIHNQIQLNINCSINGTSRMLHIFESLHIVWNFIKNGGNKYDRFAVVIDCGKTISSAAFLNGIQFRNVIENDLPLEKTQGILEKSSLLWFDCKRFYRQYNIFKNLLNKLPELIKLSVIDALKDAGLPVLFSHYTIRKVVNKSVKKIRRIEAHVVLTGNNLPKRETLADITCHVIKKLKWTWVPIVEIGEVGKVKMPPSYIWVRLYFNNKRIRTLMSSNWYNKNLVLQAEWISCRYKNKPIAIGRPDFIHRHIRFKLNSLMQF